MQSIFQSEAFQEIKNRLEQLDENTPAQWGKMNVAQMLWHCQGPLNIILEKKNYGLKPNWLIKTFFKKSMYNDKPWRHSLPTVPVFKVQSDKDFNIEITNLVHLLDELYNQKERNDWKAHPSFGDFTKDQWGQMQYKHLDHHLKQFGV
jgi:hypothetical protein